VVVDRRHGEAGDLVGVSPEPTEDFVVVEGEVVDGVTLGCVLDFGCFGGCVEEALAVVSSFDQPHSIGLKFQRWSIRCTSLTVYYAQTRVAFGRDVQMTPIFVVTHTCCGGLATDYRPYLRYTCLVKVHFVCFWMVWLFGDGVLDVICLLR